MWYTIVILWMLGCLLMITMTTAENAAKGQDVRWNSTVGLAFGFCVVLWPGVTLLSLWWLILRMWRTWREGDNPHA